LHLFKPCMYVCDTGSRDFHHTRASRL
jgi:hypothetical protein